MRFHPFLVLTFTCILSAGVLAAQEPPPATAQREIEQVLTGQAAAWNQGNIEAFMEGYAKTAALRFASGGTITRGWRETLDRYKQRYPDRAAMGTLAFSEMDVTLLSPDAATVFGRWRLRTDKGEPNGLFTLIFRKTDAGWRIVADHTSAAPTDH